MGIKLILKTILKLEEMMNYKAFLTVYHQSKINLKN